MVRLFVNNIDLSSYKQPGSFDSNILGQSMEKVGLIYFFHGQRFYGNQLSLDLGSCKLINV